MKRLFLPLIILFSILLSSCHKDDHLIKLKAYQIKVKEMYAQTRVLAAERDSALFSVMDSNLSLQETEAMKFIYAYAPLSDLADYDGKYFLSQVRMSLKAREEMPWGKDIPEQLFLHFVLPIRVNNENLDTFRSTVYEELKARVKGLDIEAAALEVNHWCHEKVTYKGSDERTSSPLASMRTSWGRCGEESTFAVSALRAVGIPARQVYTPRWAHTDDNHAWVEIWANGKWHFMGACEPEATLDKGWFSEPAKRAMLVHTRAYGWYRGNEPRIQTEERFSELNLIANYAATKDILVEVKDSAGKNVVGAMVEFKLYNYAEFFPIARSKTDAEGRTQLQCGMGDLLVWASKENKYAYKLVKGDDKEKVLLTITSARPKANEESWDLVPPAKPLPDLSDTIGRAENQRRFKQEDEIRTKYMKTFKDSSYAASLAGELNYPKDTIITLIRKSLGNWKAISTFLRNVPEDKRPWAVRLLLSITEKDLRDVTTEVLNDHLYNGMKYLGETGSRYPTVFSEYMLSPRIGNEMLRPWRGFLQNQFDRRFSAEVRVDPQILVDWIMDNITLDKVNNLHSRAPLSPQGVYELKLADQRSEDIFFVAVCRASGLPARLNAATGKPQVYLQNRWKDIMLDSKEPEILKKGSISLHSADPASDPQYTTHFTLARFTNGVYRTYEFGEGQKLSEFPAEIEVEAGDWMLVTGNRMADGGVLSMVRFFKVDAGKNTPVEVKVRRLKVQRGDYGKPSLDGLKLQLITTKENIETASLIGPKGGLFIWLDPGKEPSRHILADLPTFQKEIEEWAGPVSFIIASELIPENFNPAAISGLPSQSRFCTELKPEFIGRIESLVKTPLASNLPLIVLFDEKGTIVYYSSGYTIGIGEQIAKLTIPNN